MTKIVVQPNASGTGTFNIAAPNSNNTRTLTLPDVTDTILTTTGNGSSLTGVAKSWTESSVVNTTSGTAFDFTSLPAGLNELELLLYRVDTDNSANMLVQLGTGGTPATTGYESSGGADGSLTTIGVTNGFVVFKNGSGRRVGGLIHIRRFSGNQWVCAMSGGGNVTGLYGGGTVTLSGELNILRFTRASGNFTAGSIKLRYRA